LRKPFHSY
jgi:hypothetical protein